MLWNYWIILAALLTFNFVQAAVHHTASVSHSHNIQKKEIHRSFQHYEPFDEAIDPAAPPPSERISLPQDNYMICPNGCVCQSAHFMDLPISRWINHMQQRQAQQPQDSEELVNGNEAAYEDSFLINPFIKQATCILSAESDVASLVQSLPHDLQALILLYTEVGKQKNFNASSLRILNQLSTLEIRGSNDRNFRLIFDEPLHVLQNVNFESITLLGSNQFKRPNNSHHPQDSFDYKPKGEFADSSYDVFSAKDQAGNNAQIKLDFQPIEVEILPYDVYKEEERKARMPSFYGWQHLEVLRIHDCQLNELDWEMFDGLEALQHLSLERNSISHIPPFALFGALHIKTLSLAHNAINDLHYRALAGLFELQVLDFSNNRLSKLSELSFPPFPRLQKIDFRNNPIRYIFPATFWIMNRTREMYFDSREMPLELWGNLPFEKLQDLQELSIGNVSIRNLDTNIFKSLVSLEKLSLKGDIHSIEFDAFAGLAKLRELDLSYCQLLEISMDALIGCRQLQVLDLSHNNLSYIPPGLFDDQGKLSEIYLNHNQLRTLPTNFFLQPKLRLARLNDNPWKCSCDMQNWLPKVTNSEKASRVQRCIKDFISGKMVSCRYMDNFVIAQKYAPRCENHNDRSVFYVLRKQLRCGGKRLVAGTHRSNRTRKTSKPHWQKLNEMRDRNSSLGATTSMEQVTKTQKYVRKSSNELSKKTGRKHQNSLEFLLQQPERKMSTFGKGGHLKIRAKDSAIENEI